jgi:hypothetical protein
MTERNSIMQTSYTQHNRPVNPVALDAARLLVGLAARMERGRRLLSEGYEICRPLTATTDTAYFVDTPENRRYYMTLDLAHGIIACTCPDCQENGMFCKHLSALVQYKERIDRESDEAAAWLNAPLPDAAIAAQCDRRDVYGSDRV